MSQLQENGKNYKQPSEENEGNDPFNRNVNISTDFRTYLFTVFDHFWLSILSVFVLLYFWDGTPVTIGLFLFAIFLVSLVYYFRRVRDTRITLTEYRIILSKGSREQVYPFDDLKSVWRPENEMVRKYLLDYIHLKFDDQPNMILSSTVPNFEEVRKRLRQRLEDRNEYASVVKGAEL